jgi:hypothetical protein
VQLFLKPKAQPVLEEMHGFASETLAEAVAGMSAADQKRLIDDLEHVKRNLLNVETAAAATEPIARTNKDVGRKPSKLHRAR